MRSDFAVGTVMAFIRFIAKYIAELGNALCFLGDNDNSLSFCPLLQLHFQP